MATLFNIMFFVGIIIIIGTAFGGPGYSRYGMFEAMSMILGLIMVVLGLSFGTIFTPRATHQPPAQPAPAVRVQLTPAVPDSIALPKSDWECTMPESGNCRQYTRIGTPRY